MKGLRRTIASTERINIPFFVSEVTRIRTCGNWVKLTQASGNWVKLTQASKTM